MLHNWRTNLNRSFHKWKNINNVNNYHTIMVDALMENLFGCIIEVKLNAMGGIKW